jgi:hypothetical protein
MPARGRSWSSTATFLSGCLLVTVVAFADGGYFRESWLWTTIALASLACVVLLLREEIVLGRLDLAAVGALAAFVAWVALSAVWSSTPDDSLQESQRGLVYVAALLGFVLLVTPGDVRALLAGVAVGLTVICAYSLGTRLFADEPIASDLVSGTRLVEPVGYANALGILAAIGLLLSIGLAARGRTRLERAVWAAAPIAFLPTLVLTESRGTSFALVAGLVVLLLADTLRPAVLATALVLSLPAAAAVWLTWRASALRDAAETAEQVSDAGRRLAVALCVLALASALASLGADLVEARLRRSRRLSWVLPAALAGVLLLGVAIAALGSDRPLGPRIDYWHVAWGEWQDHAWLGSGAGTFARFWHQEGEPVDVLDAHSLYVETLAELGPVGLVLLVCALGVPILAATRTRRHALTGVAAGAYVAFLVHTGLDWDWEMPAVTLTGLLCGVALLASARAGEGGIALGWLGRVGLALAAVATAALSITLEIAV